MTFVYKEIDSNKRKSWLLILVFILIIAGLGAVVGIDGDPFAVAFIFAVGAILYSTFGYFVGPKLTLVMGSAKSITKEDDPRLYRTVENLAITAGVPMPKVHIIEDEGLNAFATGRKPETSSVAITRGLLNALDDNELQGVMAHEMAHVANYDIRLTMLVTMLVGLIAVLADVLVRVAFRGKGKKHPALMIVGLLFIILSPLIANIVQFSLSRKRESLADATAVLFTRYPEGLASALEKISKSTTPMRTANHGMAHLYISNPFKKKVNSMFSSHPPIDERIAKLRSMA